MAGGRFRARTQKGGLATGSLTKRRARNGLAHKKTGSLTKSRARSRKRGRKHLSDPFTARAAYAALLLTCDVFFAHVAISSLSTRPRKNGSTRGGEGCATVGGVSGVRRISSLGALARTGAALPPALDLKQMLAAR